MKPLPGVILMRPITYFMAWETEKDRKWCNDISKHPEAGETSYDVVISRKIQFSIVLFPLISAIQSFILHFLLKKYSKLSKSLIWKIALALFIIQPIYALLFVKNYDSYKKSKERQYLQ